MDATAFPNALTRYVADDMVRNTSDGVWSVSVLNGLEKEGRPWQKR